MSDLETAATEAMVARGISNPSDFLPLLTPEEIIETCEWWDRRKAVSPNVTAGLLGWKIKQGGVPDSEKLAPVSVVDLRIRELARRFETYALRFPEGSVVAHCRVAECKGKMVVFDTRYPVIATACDECPNEIGYTLAALDELPAKWTAADRAPLKRVT